MEPLCITTSSGRPLPYGVSVIDLKKGVFNFALVSFHAKNVTLCLFNRSKELVKEISLLDQVHKTGSVWHVELIGMMQPELFLYAFKIDPPISEKQGFLLDPYAKRIATDHDWGKGAKGYLPLGEIAPDRHFDWEGDLPLCHPLNDLIIYEMHIRAFTKHPSSCATHPGTFLGVIEKIPHLLSLGINAVELMPIQEFDETEYAKQKKQMQGNLYNFWGYSTVNYFAPMNRYATSSQSAQIECKQMVKALHQNGIEVILDIVFNHTAEGDESGPILSFKGIDNDIYYVRNDEKYLNFTGCGNTLNANQPIVQEFIIDVLRFWVSEMHVDGFRFDLAAIFSRDCQGIPTISAPIIDAITKDPILSKTKLIAEPWDAAGLYQVGSFAPHSSRWSEWNDQYRNSIRSFMRSTPNSHGAFARAISGSENIYPNQSPLKSLNFITAHDGFTLADLTSYHYKHNMNNGEDNLDGMNQNESDNCGVEGQTDDPEIMRLRARQIRNFHLALMLSQGIPMVLMGDEYGASKFGNNNTWCHDNELNWFAWDILEKKSYDNFARFFASLIQFRKKNPLLKKKRFLTAEDIDWHGILPLKVDWNRPNPFLAFTLKNQEKTNQEKTSDLYAAFNAERCDVYCKLPKPTEGTKWHLIVNTFQQSPHDFYEMKEAPCVEDEIFIVRSHSAILLGNRSF